MASRWVNVAWRRASSLTTNAGTAFKGDSRPSRSQGDAVLLGKGASSNRNYWHDASDQEERQVHIAKSSLDRLFCLTDSQQHFSKLFGFSKQALAADNHCVRRSAISWWLHWQYHFTADIAQEIPVLDLNFDDMVKQPITAIWQVAAFMTLCISNSSANQVSNAALRCPVCECMHARQTALEAIIHIPGYHIYLQLLLARARRCCASHSQALGTVAIRQIASAEKPVMCTDCAWDCSGDQIYA